MRKPTLLGKDISVIIQAGEIQSSYPEGKFKALALGFILHHKWKKNNKPSLWLFLNDLFYFVSAAS